MDQKLRQACDTCHSRKIKCTSDGSGACTFCKTNRKPCTFSPRDTMGRPRKASTETKGRRSSSKHSSRNSRSPDVRDYSSLPGIPTDIHPTGAPTEAFNVPCSVPSDFDYDACASERFPSLWATAAPQQSGASGPTSIAGSSMSYPVTMPFVDDGMLSVPDPFIGLDFDSNWTLHPSGHDTMRDINADSMLAFSTHTEHPISQPSHQLLYGLLAKTIFNFRPTFTVEWSLDEIDDRRRSEGFLHVSNLCDTLQHSLSHNLDLQAASTLVMLVTVGAELIQGAYRPLLERCLAAVRQTRRLSRSALERISATCSMITCHAHRMVMLIQQMQHLDGAQQVMNASGFASATGLQCLQQDAGDALEMLRTQAAA